MTRGQKILKEKEVHSGVAEDLVSLAKAELQSRCKDNGLSTRGSKAALLGRLRLHLGSGSREQQAGCDPAFFLRSR